jgi:hypothetical protein
MSNNSFRFYWFSSLRSYIGYFIVNSFLCFDSIRISLEEIAFSTIQSTEEQIIADKTTFEKQLENVNIERKH